MSAFDSAMSGVWMRQRPAFDAGPRRQPRQLLERANELGPAVRVAGVVERVDADEDVGAPSTSAQPSASDRKIVLRAGT